MLEDWYPLLLYSSIMEDLYDNKQLPLLASIDEHAKRGKLPFKGFCPQQNARQQALCSIVSCSRCPRSFQYTSEDEGPFVEASDQKQAETLKGR